MKPYVLFCCAILFLNINGAHRQTPMGSPTLGGKTQDIRNPPCSFKRQTICRTIPIPQKDQKLYYGLWKLFNSYEKCGSKADDKVAAQNQVNIIAEIRSLISENPVVLSYPNYIELSRGKNIDRRLVYPLEFMGWMVACHCDGGAERRLLTAATSLEIDQHFKIKVIKIYGISNYSFSVVESMLKAGKCSVELYPEIMTHLVDTCEKLHCSSSRDKQLSYKKGQLIGITNLLLSAGVNCSVVGANISGGKYDTHFSTDCLLMRSIEMNMQLQQQQAQATPRKPKFKKRPTELVCTTLPYTPTTLSSSPSSSSSSSLSSSSPSPFSPSSYSPSIVSPTSASSVSASLQLRKDS